MDTQKITKEDEENQYLQKFTTAFNEKFKCRSKTIYVPELGIYITCIAEGERWRCATDFEQAWISGYSFAYSDWG